LSTEVSLTSVVVTCGQSERQSLIEEGFPGWARKDFKALLAALEQKGRRDRVRLDLSSGGALFSTAR
jgi:predicted alpha/beta hydrolase